MSNINKSKHWKDWIESMQILEGILAFISFVTQGYLSVCISQGDWNL